MQYLISHRSALPLAASTFAAMAISLLLVLAASASADSLADPIAAEESSGATELVPVPATEAEPVASTDESAAAPSDQATSSPVSQPASSPISAPASDASDAVSAAASEAASSARNTLAEANPDPVALAPQLPQATVSEHVEQVHHAVNEATGLARTSAKIAVQAVHRATDAIQPAEAPVQRPLQIATRALREKVLDPLTPSTSQLPQPAARVSGPEEGGSSPLPPMPSIPSPTFSDALPLQHHGALGGRLGQYLAEPGKAELGQRFENGAPTNSKGPAPFSALPELPQLIASGISSSFVHIAAMLALLALAAPAILRRFREAPGFRAPAPFVCALERPG